MRAWKPIAAGLAVLASTIASGTLECNPLRETREVAHGREVYGRMCAVCHGAEGEGYRADQAPALAHPDFIGSVSDPFLLAAITHGRAGTTMSAWGVEHGGPLSPAEARSVIEFLHTFRKGDAPSVDERPIEGDATRGQAVFARECSRCHGDRGTGGAYENIGNPQLLATASNGFLRLAIHRGRAPTLMPAFEKQLSDQDIEDVLSLLRAWQTSGGSPLRAPVAAKPPPLPLGPVPLNPSGPEPVGFASANGLTKADVIHEQLVRGARMGILDARAPSDYANEHIEGAVSVPFYDPTPYFDQLPKDAWLVCYCGCPHAESGQLASKLKAKGFTKVTVLDEGLGYWSRKFTVKVSDGGPPVASGKTYGTRKGTLP
jgi:cytochrome c oxidase cbb3-type subunit 3/ubiquinol-cytochrome c reductase cytochrome c subunit